MPVFRLTEQLLFPDPELAEDGLLAIGGDLSVPRLVLAYESGIFPWFGEEDPLLWWSPPERALLRPGCLHLSARTLRSLRQRPFEIRFDTAFEQVITHCATAPRLGQDGTWITVEMREAYLELHHAGHAHSVEAWREGELRGGLYGVSLGGAFFGESMFSLEAEASRAALRALDARLAAWGFTLLDGQLPHEGLMGYGFQRTPRIKFLAGLAEALQLEGRPGSWSDQ
ncbi:leucyl/phenylalanyl-tRNA--protein transferase [Geothrix sp. PMB-07]|uniref:leucyl/phenylalanyl-tRNA--protein transferase n=1 Tax=Geothrix sp. PMB-07 TaxID=3068640 RepID=UPI00274122AE|nr:leucyl/phenylalanyl-tRNA--protein transferase [Geothrix sp. PMB-07]WLT31278.1 leucyl/phenylalanyl-tRNA--protein transferase [Geothrix sp. PMB-07]